jgi:regulatory protein
MKQTITDLKLDRRNHGRVRVYLNHGYAFSVNLLDAADLAKGCDISDEKISKLRHKHDRYEAYIRSIKYISYRLRSRREVEQYLTGKRFSPEIIADTITRLTGENLLNDTIFAQSWINNRNKFKPRATTALRFELLQKGIDKDIIETALTDVDDEVLACTIVERRLGRWGKLNRKDAKVKIFNYLRRRGFNYEISMNAYRYALSLQTPPKPES